MYEFGEPELPFLSGLIPSVYRYSIIPLARLLGAYYLSLSLPLGR